MMTTWSSSAAQPIHGWQQGSHFASSPYSSGFLHGGMQRPRQSPYYSESLRSSYQSAQAQETLQFQDELNELMMGNPEGCEPQSSVSPDTTHPSYRWSGEGQCDNAFSPSFDDSIMASSSEYGMSSFSSCTHSTATSPQEPATPAAHQWETQQTGPHIRRDSVNMTVNGLLRPYSQYDSFNMSLQQSDTIQECEDQKVNPAHMPDLVDPCQFVPSSKLAPSVFTPAWSINPDFGLPDSIGDMSSSHDADPFFHRVRWLPEGARPQSSVRAEQDRLIIEGKRRNMSYKEIKEHYKIEGAVSTLRGRYRAAVKPKSQRVRKPEWKPKDVSLPIPAMFPIQLID
jgi:hypothetical protein